MGVTEGLSQDADSFSTGTDSGRVMMGIFDDVSPLSLSEGQQGALRSSAARELYVVLRDAAGNERGLNIPASGLLGISIEGDNVGIGGGTQYNEDDAAAANPTGTVPLLIRADTPAAVTSTDGDNIAQRATNYGAAYVQVLDSSGNYINTFGGSGGTASTDDSAFTAGSGQGTPAMGFFSADTVDAGDVGVLAMDASRRLLVSLEVDNAGIGGGTQYAEDSVHNSGDTGTMMLGVRNDTLASLVGTDGDYAPLQLNGDGALYTTESNAISTNNSTTSTLAGDATYTGTGEDVANYASITITLDSSHDSATNGMTFQFSTDNSNWDDVYTFTYTAADGARRFQFPVTAQYFRVVYTNGSTLQTTFRVQTILHKKAVSTSVHRLVDNVDPDRSANLVKAAIVAQGAGTGDFIPVQATAGGNFKVALEEYEGVPTGGGTESGALRVTLPTDGTGVVTETNSTAILADTANMDTNLTTIAGAVSGAEMQVDIVGITPDLMLGTDFSAVLGTSSLILATQADDVANTSDGLQTSSFGYWFDGTTWDRARGDSANGLLVNLGGNNDVTLATLPDTASSDLATISGDTTAIQAAVEIIDNCVYVDDADWTDSTSSHALTGGLYQSTPQSVTDGDTGPFQTDSNGRILTGPPDKDVTTHSKYARKYYTAATPTDGIVWSPAAGTRWHVVSLYLNVSAASTVTLEDDKAGGDDPVWKGELAANSGVYMYFGDKYPMASGEDAADLTVTATAGTVYITAIGYEV